MNKTRIASGLGSMIVALHLIGVGQPALAQGGCQDLGGYPWKTGGCLLSEDLNNAIAGRNPLLNMPPKANLFVNGFDNGMPLTAQISFSNLSGAIVPTQIPRPTASSLGGVLSYVAPGGQFLYGITTAGQPVSRNPTFSDISGSVGPGQMPEPTPTTLGGLKSFAPITGRYISGLDDAGNLLSSNLPNITDGVVTTNFVKNNVELKSISGVAGDRVHRFGFTTQGDGGAANYDWSPTNCVTPDDGAQVQPTATGCWVADLTSREVPVEVWGCNNTGSIDAAACLNRSAAALEAVGGGTLILAKRYLVSSATFLIPAGVTVRGTWARPGVVWGGSYTNVQSALVVNSAYTVRVNSGGGLKNIMVVRQGILAPGAVGTTLAQNLQTAYAQLAAFAGTGVTLGDGTANGGGWSTLARDLLILGFNRCLDATGADTSSITGVYGDCTNGLKLQRIGERPTVSSNSFWPFLMFGGGDNFYQNGVTGGQVYFYTRNISAIANATGKIRITTTAAHDFQTGNTVIISGANTNTGANNTLNNPMWTVTRISNTQFDLNGSTFSNTSGAVGSVYTSVVFREGAAFQLTSDLGLGCDHCAMNDSRAFGYKIGFDFIDSDHVILTGSRADTWFAPQRKDTIGLYVHGAAGKVTASDLSLAAFGNLIQYNVPTAIVPHSSLSNVDLWGCNGNSIYMAGGSLTINGGVIDSTPISGSTFGNCGITAVGGTLHLTGGLQIQNNALNYSGGNILVGEAYTANGRLSPLSSLVDHETFFMSGAITASRTHIFNVSKNLHTYVNMQGSDCRSESNATGNTVFNLFKNTTNIGTVTFAAGTTFSTIVAAAQVDFTTGDRFKMIAPVSPDATLSNVSCSFAFGYR